MLLETAVDTGTVCVENATALQTEVEQMSFAADLAEFVGKHEYQSIVAPLEFFPDNRRQTGVPYEREDSVQNFKKLVAAGEEAKEGDQIPLRDQAD